jgi:peptidyl-tRNA hydrolase ICT1
VCVCVSPRLHDRSSHSIEGAHWIEEDTKERLRSLYANRVNKEDELVINSTRHRTQNQNLKDCYEKLAVLIEQASIVPKEVSLNAPGSMPEK